MLYLYAPSVKHFTSSDPDFLQKKPKWFQQKSRGINCFFQLLSMESAFSHGT